MYKTDLTPLHINCTNCTMIAEQPHIFKDKDVFVSRYLYNHLPSIFIIIVNVNIQLNQIYECTTGNMRIISAMLLN